MTVTGVILTVTGVIVTVTGVIVSYCHRCNSDCYWGNSDCHRCNIKQLWHSHEVDMMFYGAKKTHIDRGRRPRLIFVFCAP